MNSVTIAGQIVLQEYAQFIGITFLYHDHLLTFSDEINRIWSKPKSASAYWFGVNRYLAFFGNTTVLVMMFQKLSIQVCRRWTLFRQLLIIVQQVLIGVLLTLRIYALYGRSKPILIFMISCGLLLLGIACWAMLGQKSAPSREVFGCHNALSRETGLHLAAAWEALMGYDALLFFMTLLQTWRQRHRHGFALSSIPIISLVFRDGAIYFAVMAIANMCNILTFYLAADILRGCLSTFASNISVTMMSRLMLNLHSFSHTCHRPVGLFSNISPISENTIAQVLSTRIAPWVNSEDNGLADFEEWNYHNGMSATVLSSTPTQTERGVK